MGVIAHGIPQSPPLDVPVDPSNAIRSGGPVRSSGPGGSGGSGESGELGGDEPGGAPESAYDLDRLERAISALVDENARLRDESARLQRVLDEKGARITALEGQLLDANQRRQDVIKRVDELIAQMDALDAQLEQAEPDVS